MKPTTEQLEALKQFIETGEVEMIRYFVATLNIQVEYSHPIISAIYKSKKLDAGEKHGIAMSMIKKSPKPNEETRLNLTTEQLQKIIKEELGKVISEMERPERDYDAALGSEGGIKKQ